MTVPERYSTMRYAVALQLNMLYIWGDGFCCEPQAQV